MSKEVSTLSIIFVSNKQVYLRTQSQKPFKFHLEVKGQRRIGIYNVRDTSSHGDTPMCKIW